MRPRARALVGLAAAAAVVGGFVSAGSPDQTAGAVTASTAMPTGPVVSNGTTWTPSYSQNFTTDAARDRVAGYKLAFLLWPTSDDWSDGEIDWPDGNLAGAIYPASKIVGSSTNAFDGPSHDVTSSMGTGWHTAVTEWTKGTVRWYLDGKLVGQTTNAAGVPTKPMRWTLQVETNTDGKAVSASAQGHVQVAWVVQYR